MGTPRDRLLRRLRAADHAGRLFVGYPAVCRSDAADEVPGPRPRQAHHRRRRGPAGRVVESQQPLGRPRPSATSPSRAATPRPAGRSSTCATGCSPSTSAPPRRWRTRCVGRARWCGRCRASTAARAACALRRAGGGQADRPDPRLRRRPRPRAAVRGLRSGTYGGTIASAIVPRSLRRPTAVDRQVGAGDLARRVRAQEHRQRGDLLDGDEFLRRLGRPAARR